jgi:hypothetical protein
MKLTDTELRAWRILHERGPMRGSDLGWELWGENTKAPGRGEGSHGHNKFCRPAGKLLKRLKEAGMVREKHLEHCTVWMSSSENKDDDLSPEHARSQFKALRQFLAPPK